VLGTGCAGGPAVVDPYSTLAIGERPGPRAERPATEVDEVLLRAISLIGTPYRYGGSAPDIGFDCSGLIGYVFREAAGISLPRTTGQLASMPVPQVGRERLRPGDLVFFGRRGRVDHAGIYVGGGRFIHAPSSGGAVRIDVLSGPYWRKHYLQARRILA
jgi:cell wall-associated NlpC family hydrolase